MKNKHKVTFRILDAGHLYGQIQSRLGVYPSRSGLKGELKTNSSVRRWKHDAWIISVDVGPDQDVNYGIKVLYDTIVNHIEYIREIMSGGCQVDIGLGLLSSSDNSGFELSSESVAMLGELRIPVGFTYILR